MARKTAMLAAVALLAACPKRVLSDLDPAIAPRSAPTPALSADARAWFLRATVAESRGDTAEAERAWGWVLRVEPRDPWARLHQGAFLERLGRRDEAVEAYRTALSLHPGLPEAELAVGRALVVGGRDEEARPHLERAATPDGPEEAWHLLGRLLVRGGHRDAAGALLDRWLEVPVAVGPAALDRARLAMSLDRPGDAVDDLVTSLDTYRADPPTAELLIDAARRSCRVGTAWRWGAGHRMVRRPQAGWQSVALELGRAVGDPELVAEAIGALGPDGADGVRERARALEAMGRPEQAVTWVRTWRAALGAPGLLLEEARLLHGAGRVDEALTTLDALPATDPAAPDALTLRVEWLLARGDTAEALRVAQAATAAFPEAVGPWRAAAWAAAAAGDREAALGWLDAVPTWSPALRAHERGRLLLQLGDPDAAARALEAAGRAGHSAAWRTRAQTAATPADALVAWRALVEVDPRDGAAWLEIARLDPDDADAIPAALRADPCDPDALLAAAAREPACAAAVLLERAAEAAPRAPAVLTALEAGWVGCGTAVADRRDDSASGLRRVEQTWYLVGDPEAAERVRAARQRLERR